MKTKLSACLTAMLLLVFVGCEGGTSGGPGATPDNSTSTSPSTTSPTDNMPSVTQEDNSFSLNVPNLATSFKQGETKQIAIAIDRGTNFDQDVTLKFEGVPQGVTMDPAEPAIKAGEKEANISVQVAEDAALGDHEITVMGHPATGPDAKNMFKIQIEAK